jgi:hypothetical protein
MNRVRYTNWAVDSAGNVQGGAAVAVRDTAGDLVTIYDAASGGSALSNPLTAEVDGYFEFYADPGSYDVTTGAGASAATARAALARPINDNSNVVYAVDYGVTADGVTDDRAALQAAIDVAIDPNTPSSRVLQLPSGNILIDGTLTISGASNRALHMRGANSGYLGTTRLVHGSTQKLNPLLNIRATRGLHITDIEFRGNNTAPQEISAEAYRDSRLANWITDGCSSGRYNPYAAITFSALLGTQPASIDDRYTFGEYGQSGKASKTFFERVRVQGFVAVCVIGPNDNTSGLEDIMFRDCTLVENTYGICTTGTQQRNVVAENCNILAHWAAFDSVTFGAQAGQPVQRRTNNMGKCVYAEQSATSIGVANVTADYYENVRNVGVIGTGTTSAFMPRTFADCNFSLIGHDDDGTQTQKDVPLTTFAPVQVKGGAWLSKNLLPLYIHRSIEFDGTQFRCENTGSEDIFGLYTRISGGLRFYVSLRNCGMRAYSGPTRWINDVEKVASMPTRALIGENTRGAWAQDTGKEYRITRHPLLSRGPNIANISYDSADEISFDYTPAQSDKPVFDGDLLYWDVRCPLPNDAAGDSILLPALRITDITGTRITCDVLADIDTTFQPNSIEVYVQNFVNLTEATGDCSFGSADVTNVTNISNFEVSDWVQVDGSDVAERLRIEAINGTTLTFTRSVRVTGTGVSLYNARLREI